MYVALFPCNECAKLIIQSGVKDVVFLSDKYHDDEIMVASRRLFDLAGVRPAVDVDLWVVGVRCVGFRRMDGSPSPGKPLDRLIRWNRSRRQPSVFSLERRL